MLDDTLRAPVLQQVLPSVEVTHVAALDDFYVQRAGDAARVKDLDAQCNAANGAAGVS